MSLKNEWKGIWVYGELANGRVREVTYELLGEAALLARELETDVTCALIGSKVEGLIPSLAACGADRVVLLDDEQLAWPDEMRYAGELAALIAKHKPSIVLIGATSFGRSLAPRVAARLRTGLTADCTRLSVDVESGELLQTRPAFGGNLLATILCPNTRPQMATVRPKVFPRPAAVEGRACAIIREQPQAGASPIRLLETMAGEQGVNLADYDVLVSVGQGIGGAANIALAAEVAELLGGTLSGSRPLVDAGMLPYARQVGQTGKAVAPKLYLALGISGAIQHMAGVDADCIVAVNTDPDAPIFASARYAVVGDCVEFLRELADELRARVGN